MDVIEIEIIFDESNTTKQTNPLLKQWWPSLMTYGRIVGQKVET